MKRFLLILSVVILLLGLVGSGVGALILWSQGVRIAQTTPTRPRTDKRGGATCCPQGVEGRTPGDR